MNTLIICLFITILLPYIVKIRVMKLIKKEAPYDNNHPRMQQAQLVGAGARAIAAHQNGFESLSVFATAALTAMATNHIGVTIQLLAVIYIISRIAYNILYIKNLASLRSMTWFVSLLCCLSILLLCLV